MTPSDTSISVLIDTIRADRDARSRILAWPDLVRVVTCIHGLKGDESPAWTQKQTADLLGLDPRVVSMYVIVSQELDDPRVASATTVRHAYAMTQRRAAKRQARALESLLGSDAPKALASVPADPDSIICADFVEWATRYSGPRFTLVHCDFPDTLYATMLNTLLFNMDRLVSTSAHLMVWCPIQHVDYVTGAFRKVVPEVSFRDVPLVWQKTRRYARDNGQGPIRSFETCLLGTRGGRTLVKRVADSYSAPALRDLTVKPEPMLRYFMSMLVDTHTSLLDPTCGTGTALRAAESLGASHVMGIDIDPKTCELARHELARARVARRAADALK